MLELEPGLLMRSKAVLCCRYKAVLCYRYTLLSTEVTDLPSREQFFEDVLKLFTEGILFIQAEVLRSWRQLTCQHRLHSSMPQNN